MIKAQWKSIFKDRMMMISIFAVLFIPVLYAAVYLWSFWDPYGNLDKLPVAIINEDSGANYNGEKLTLGETLTDKLIDSKEFNFQEVSKEEGKKGLENRDYYLLIEIPSNFSQHATTLLDDQPEKMVITYTPNEGYNFLSSQIGKSAMESIRAQVNEEVTTTYAEQLFDSIAELGDGFGEASDGAGELKDGAVDLNNGASDLKGYLEQLASSTIELRDGTNTVAAGIQTAADGSTQLNSGLSQLSNGASQLAGGTDQTATGAKSLQEGITKYTQGMTKLNESYQLLSEKEKALVDSLAQLQSSSAKLSGSTNEVAQGSAQVTEGIGALSKQLEQLSATLEPEQAAHLMESIKKLEAGSTAVTNGLQQLTSGTEQLSSGTAQIHSGAERLSAGYAQALQGVAQLNEGSPALMEGSARLAEGTSTLSTKMKELQTGIQQAYTGSTNLNSGLKQLASGSSQLQQGTGVLAEKSGEISEGSAKLADGTKALVDGTNTMQTKLADANKEASEVKATDDTLNMVAAPIEVEKESVHEVPNYGTGLTPYFLSLGLFVGALIISVVFPFVEPAITPKNGTSWFLSKTSVLAVVGLLQSMIVVGISLFVLKLEPESTGMFILTAVITSYTYLAIIQLFVSVLDNPGRFVAILVLILQLSTSAGTFPLELIPEQMQVFNKLLPMAYSVQSFRAAISTGDIDFFWHNNTVLLGFMAASLVLTLSYFMFIFKKRYANKNKTAEA